MRKASKKTTQPTVTLKVIPLVSVYSADTIGVCVTLRGNGDHGSTVERHVMAKAFAIAAKILLLDTPAAMPRVTHTDSWRAGSLGYISTARVDVECAQHADVARYVAAVKEALNVA